MADDFISDNTYKLGVLGLISAGVTLITYHTFFKKRSYLVEYTILAKDSEAIQDSVSFDARLLDIKNHNDVYERVLEHVKSKPDFDATQEVTLQISHIHTL